MFLCFELTYVNKNNNFSIDYKYFRSLNAVQNILR